jgi:hypothetical protein
MEAEQSKDAAGDRAEKSNESLTVMARRPLRENFTASLMIGTQDFHAAELLKRPAGQPAPR